MTEQRENSAGDVSNETEGEVGQAKQESKEEVGEKDSAGQTLQETVPERNLAILREAARQGITFDGQKILDIENFREFNPEHIDSATGMIKREYFEKNIRPNYFIILNPAGRSITCTMQCAPVGEVGVEGVQYTAFVELAVYVIGRLHESYPCDENVQTLHHWQLGLNHQKARTERRLKAGIEGTYEEQTGV